jgi:hypothetical protein
MQAYLDWDVWLQLFTLDRDVWLQLFARASGNQAWGGGGWEQSWCNQLERLTFSVASALGSLLRDLGKYLIGK